MHTFLHRLRTDDRVLLVGDVRQHEAVDAGRPYRQLQEAGITTARLNDLVRQKDPALKTIVEQLSRGDVRASIEQLDAQGRVHEIPRREERLTAIAHEYVKDPQATLVVSPDNQSRQDINEVVHRTMQREGHVSRHEQIRCHAVLPAEWTAESEELTPTLKLKRRVILDKYAEVIESLYSGVATATPA